MLDDRWDSHTSHFVAYGVPIPQAGTRIVQTAAGPRGITAGSPRLRPWRDVLSSEAQVCQIEGRRHTGPVAVEVEFRFPMTATRQKVKKYRNEESIPKPFQPDLDKLLRAVFDSLTVGGLLLDDAQVCEVHATKREYVEGWSGANVLVRDLWTP